MRHMIQAQRHQQILAKLQVEGQITVKDLSEEFQVTKDCIRKDLTLLEEQGKLKRVHGGATKVRQNPHVFQVEDRKGLHLKEKKMIAQKAIEMIEPGMMIFLDISTITLEIAKLIFQNDLQVTLVTNMIDIMNMFRQDSLTKVIFLGGEYNQAKDGFVGTLTIQQLKKYNFDLAFIGVVGIDLHNNQVMTYEVNDGQTKSQIISSSKVCYIVAESIKLDMDGNYAYAQLSDFTGFITEKKLNDRHIEKMQEYGLEVI